MSSKFCLLGLLERRDSVAHTLLQRKVLRAPFASLSDSQARIAVELMEVSKLGFPRLQVLIEGRCTTARNACGLRLGQLDLKN